MVDSSTAYTYDSRTRTYLQPNFSYEILRRFFSVNQSALQHMKSRGELVTELQSLPEGTPLSNFVQAGLSYKEDAPAVLSALMDELSRQTTYVPTVYLTISGLNISTATLCSWPSTIFRRCTTTPLTEILITAPLCRNISPFPV